MVYDRAFPSFWEGDLDQNRTGTYTFAVPLRVNGPKGFFRGFVAVDGLPNPKGDDLSWLKGSGRGAGARVASKIILGITGLIVGFLALVFVSHRVSGGEAHYQELHRDLSSIQEPWSDEFSSQVDAYHSWLENHGTSLEMEVFEDIA